MPKKPEPGIRSITAGVTSRSVGSLAVDLGERFGEDQQFGVRLNVGGKDGEQAVKDADWTQKAVTLAADWRVEWRPDAVGRHRIRREPLFHLAALLPAGAGIGGAACTGRQPQHVAALGRLQDRRHQHLAARRLADRAGLDARRQGLHSTNYRPNTKEARFGQIYAADGAAFLFGAQDGGNKTYGDTAQVALRGKFNTGSVGHAITVAASNTETEGKAGTTNPLGVFPTNIYNPTGSLEPAGAPNGPLLTYQKSSTTSLLASDIVSFNEQWSALLGFRHARLTLDNYDPASGALLNSNPLTKTSPVGAIMFKPTPSSLLYVNYAQGVEPGGTGRATGHGQPEPGAVADRDEAGRNRRQARHRQRAVDAGGLRHAQALRVLDPSSLRYVQNGEQRHRGIELLATGKLTPDLSLVTGLMWMNPKVSSTGDPATEGRRPVGVSRWIANAFLDYRIGAVPGLFVNGGVYYASSQYLDGANLQEIPSWTRFDAGLRYETRVKNAR